ncbi:hypothetical protein FQN49_008524 [Arthroderma sp. PD_2]|nr:hypothetical protein FQN49_008524 [Arthroderma sp. PD_2]
MHLLQLPLEVFRDILERVVSDLNMLAAVKLRRVNKLFNCEILRACASTDAIDIHVKWETPLIGLFSRYAIQRPYPKTLPTSSIVTRMNYVVDELAKHEESDSSEHLRFELHHLRYRNIHLYIQKTGTIGSTPDSHHVALAAVYLGRHDYFQSLVESEQLNISGLRSDIFGTPLLAAIDGGHYDYVLNLLDRYGASNMKQELDYLQNMRVYRFSSYLNPAACQGDIQIVRLLLRPEYGLAASKAELREAFSVALGENHSDIAHLLLDHLTPDFGESRADSPGYLTFYLRKACTSGDLGIVQRLVSLGADVNYRYEYGYNANRPAVLAAWKGHKKVLQHLLDNGLNIHETYFPFLAMAAAAWGGHADIAKILLDAGMQMTPIEA